MNYNSKYVVRLTEEERNELQGVLRRGKVAAAKRTRAQVLLSFTVASPRRKRVRSLF